MLALYEQSLAWWSFLWFESSAFPSVSAGDSPPDCLSISLHTHTHTQALFERAGSLEIIHPSNSHMHKCTRTKALKWELWHQSISRLFDCRAKEHTYWIYVWSEFVLTHKDTVSQAVSVFRWSRSLLTWFLLLFDAGLLSLPCSDMFSSLRSSITYIYIPLP